MLLRWPGGVRILASGNGGRSLQVQTDERSDLFIFARSRKPSLHIEFHSTPTKSRAKASIVPRFANSYQHRGREPSRSANFLASTTLRRANLAPSFFRSGITPRSCRTPAGEKASARARITCRTPGQPVDSDLENSRDIVQLRTPIPLAVLKRRDQREDVDSRANGH